MDAGYKTPPIARKVIQDGLIPIFPYKRPMTKKGFFYKKDYIYDEYYDCYMHIKVMKVKMGEILTQLFNRF